MPTIHNKVNHISDLFQRVACSCITTHNSFPRSFNYDDDSDCEENGCNEIVSNTASASFSPLSSTLEEQPHTPPPLEDEKVVLLTERLKQMETLTSEVFEAVTALKRTYVGLQEAHSPWDPERMRSADALVVGELRRLGRLRDRFRRGGGVNVELGGTRRNAAAVEAYEMAMEEMRREMKRKELEIANLKEDLKAKNFMTRRGSERRKGIRGSGNRVRCVTGVGTPLAAPTPELFKTCMEEVKSSSKSFTAHLLSLMRAARWDLSSISHSIVENTDTDDPTTDHFIIPNVDPSHAKYALESYVNRKLFHGFENETFYIEGSLTSLLHPCEFRRDCFAQFHDMRSMDPGEILGILPTCQFGKFARKKYLTIIHSRMEESLFGSTDQRRQVFAGGHPRTGSYAEYLKLAKAIWLLHLLAFALDPPPSHFEASKGAEFHPDYMDSVVKLEAGGRVGNGWVVGSSVAPGFKLGNGSVVKARVYLVPAAVRGTL